MLVAKKVLSCLSLGCVLLPVCGCLPTEPLPDEWADVAVTAEIEPNNSYDSATAVTFDASGRARLQGQIPTVTETVGWDFDFYALGAMEAGDRIIVDVDMQGTLLNMVAAIFDADGQLFIVNNDEDLAAGKFDPYIDGVFHHQSSGYYLIVSRVAWTGREGAEYEIHVTVERGGAAPAPQPQTVLLDFVGATVALPNVGAFTVAPFDAADIDSRYTGQTAFIKSQIIQTVKQNYARYNVTVLNTDEHEPPADGQFSRIYFGGSDPSGLGVALTGTDFYNTNPSDEAIVFTGRFTPDLFTNPPDAEQLGTAIGNVAAHEIGHLLGLSHVNGKEDVMNSYDAPDNRLNDLRFEQNFLDTNIFPVYATETAWLVQNGKLMLVETVGLIGSVSNWDETVGSGPSSLAAVDFDSDGDLDLAVACPFSSEVYLLWNEGDGTFPTHLTATGFGSLFIEAADFAGTSDVDLMVSDLDDNPEADGVYLFVSEGGGSFAAPVGYSVPDGLRVASSADFDGDGDIDLAMAHSLTDTVSILFNQGDGTFGEATSIGELPFPLGIAAGDLDGDGDQDLAVGCLGKTDEDGQGGVWLLYNNGDATFELGGNVIGDVLAEDVTIGDVNNDGWLDLAVADQFTAHAVVLINDGTGGFDDPSKYLVGNYPTSVRLGDLDDDGALDLVVVNYGTNDISVLFNHGDGTFELEWPYGVGDNPQTVAIADLDGDGDSDLAVANDASGSVSILLNNGDKTFGQTPGVANSVSEE